MSIPVKHYVRLRGIAYRRVFARSPVGRHQWRRRVHLRPASETAADSVPPRCCSRSYGFVSFLLSSLLWTGVGLAQREPSLVVLQGAFTAIDPLGIYRWTTV